MSVYLSGETLHNYLQSHFILYINMDHCFGTRTTIKILQYSRLKLINYIFIAIRDKKIRMMDEITTHFVFGATIPRFVNQKQHIHVELLVIMQF